MSVSGKVITPEARMLRKDDWMEIETVGKKGAYLEGHSGGRHFHLLFDFPDNAVKKHSTHAPYFVE
jgi:hypothetical protein